jgi:hypothetical protein
MQSVMDDLDHRRPIEDVRRNGNDARSPIDRICPIDPTLSDPSYSFFPFPGIFS